MSFYIRSVWLQLMPCSECGVFEGTPTCGACKAVARICGALRSGLLASQERRATEVLRGSAGELADLIEGVQPLGSQGGSTPSQEGTPGLSSGPPQAAAVKAEAKKKEEASEDYSYITGEGEESENEVIAEEAVAVEVAAKDSSKAEDKGRATQDSSTRASTPKGDSGVKGSWDPRCDPNYLTNRLCLRPAPKPRSGREGEDKRARSPEGEPPGRSGAGAPDERTPRSADRKDGEREERSPLRRRLPTKDRTKKRGTRGAKKRQRTQEFRNKKIEERRAKKAARDRSCRQKPKQREWREDWES